MLRAVLDIIPIAHGKITIKASKIAYVPQRLPAVSGIPISVYESVASGLLDGKIRLFSKKADKARVLQALKQLQIEELAGKSLAKLSGGQLRRVMIAKALVSKPDLMLLDEPTAGLDSNSQKRLLRTLRELKEAGVTILLITHELGGLSVLVDRAVVLDRKAKKNISYFGKLPIPLNLEPESHHSEELKAKISESVLGLNS